MISFLDDCLLQSALKFMAAPVGVGKHLVFFGQARKKSIQQARNE